MGSETIELPPFSLPSPVRESWFSTMSAVREDIFFPFPPCPRFQSRHPFRLLLWLRPALRPLQRLRLCSADGFAPAPVLSPALTFRIAHSTRTRALWFYHLLLITCAPPSARGVRLFYCQSGYKWCCLHAPTALLRPKPIFEQPDHNPLLSYLIWQFRVFKTFF